MRRVRPTSQGFNVERSSCSSGLSTQFVTLVKNELEQLTPKCTCSLGPVAVCLASAFLPLPLTLAVG